MFTLQYQIESNWIVLFPIPETVNAQTMVYIMLRNTIVYIYINIYVASFCCDLL